MRNMKQQLKQDIRAFLRSAYTDQRLAEVLAHAQDGKLSYWSCCCLRGAATADHALKPMTDDWNAPHYSTAMDLPNSAQAAVAYLNLGGPWSADDAENEQSDSRRRRIVIPILRAEIRRRDKLRAIEALRPAGAEVVCR